MKKRLFYPYCGYHGGFCLAKNGCIYKEIPIWSKVLKCPHWRARHPVTKQVPQEL